MWGLALILDTKLNLFLQRTQFSWTSCLYGEKKTKTDGVNKSFGRTAPHFAAFNKVFISKCLSISASSTELAHTTHKHWIIVTKMAITSITSTRIRPKSKKAILYSWFATAYSWNLEKSYFPVTSSISHSLVTSVFTEIWFIRASCEQVFPKLTEL